MDANELAEKLRNKNSSYEEVFQWCEQNIDSIDLNDENQQYLYDTIISYMMKSRINHLSTNEASLMVKYLSKSYIHEKGLDDRIKVDVLDKETFMAKYKDEEIRAMCRTLKGTRFTLDYSDYVLQDLMSGNINRFLDGLKTIYHETAHVIQESCIALTEINGEKVHYSASLYQIALENTTRKADPQFYKLNYDKLVLENQANKVRINKRLFSNC